MLIGCIADTHIPTRAKRIPDEALEAFQEVDAVFHCGDMVTLEALEPLERMARVVAVRGNMDESEVVQRFATRVVVPVGNLRIGLTHGSGMPRGLAQRIWRQFADVEVDAIVFGHSHVPFAERIGGVFMFNPGSATSNGAAGYCSVGILDVDDGISGRIVRLP